MLPAGPEADCMPRRSEMAVFDMYVSYFYRFGSPVCAGWAPSDGCDDGTVRYEHAQRRYWLSIGSLQLFKRPQLHDACVVCVTFEKRRITRCMQTVSSLRDARVGCTMKQVGHNGDVLDIRLCSMHELQ